MPPEPVSIPLEDDRPAVTAGPSSELPLLLRAANASRLGGVSLSTWWRLHAAKACPAPVRVGGATMWRRADLELWVELGCPSRREFESRRKK